MLVCTPPVGQSGFTQNPGCSEGLGSLPPGFCHRPCPAGLSWELQYRERGPWATDQAEKTGCGSSCEQHIHFLRLDSLFFFSLSFLLLQIEFYPPKNMLRS